jgi:type II secretory pathway component GspD/PulD (secretin)
MSGGVAGGARGPQGITRVGGPAAMADRRCALWMGVALLVCAAAALGQPGRDGRRGDGPRGPEVGAAPATDATDADGASAAAGAGDAADTDPRPIVEVGPQGVSVYAVRQDVHAVLTEIARKTGFPVIVDDTVKGVVTVNFRNRKVTEILEAVAATYGFACREQDGVFVVTEGLPAHVSSYLLSDIARVTPNYIPAGDAEQLLPVFLQDYTAASATQNSVVLSAPPEILEKFRGDVERFDIPAAQIMIDVLMVEYTEDNSDEFWATLGWSDAVRGASTNSATGDMSYQVFGGLPNEFHVSLRALEAKGRAHVRANPKIATVSGQEAHIFIGQRRFLETPVEVTGDDDEAGNNNQQIHFINAGVNLAITPWTGGEGEIVADIKTEVSTMSAPDPVTGLPQKQTREADTVVRMLDRETVIIGGLVHSEMIESRSKVPILGDIPLLGKLFRSKDMRELKTELVVFITATILGADGELPADGAAATPSPAPVEGGNGAAP